MKPPSVNPILNDRPVSNQLEARESPGLKAIHLAAVAVGLVALVVYAMTLLPGVGFWDCAEMQTVPYLLGIAHPTGYPLYTLLGKFFSMIPIGSIAYRANLLSAVCASLALSVSVLAMGVLGVRPIIAAAAALTFGATASLWTNAVRAEVHTLHLLIVALMIHRMLVWSQLKRLSDLAFGALLLGLGFGNHMLMSTVAPFVALYVLWVGRAAFLKRPWLLAVAGLAFCLGLSVYAYIPLRAMQNPLLAYNHPVTWEKVRYLVTGEQFRTDMAFLSVEGLQRFVKYWPSVRTMVMTQATPLFGVLAIVGGVLMVTSRSAFGLFGLGLLLTNVYIVVNYTNADLLRYLFASWLILSMWMAYAAERAIASLPQRLGPMAWGLLLIPLGLAISNWKDVDQSQNRSGEQFVKTVFEHLPPNAALISYWDASTPLWYAHHVERQRPDLMILDDTDLVYGSWGGLGGALDRLVGVRPVYLLRAFDKDGEALKERYRLVPVTTLDTAYGKIYPEYKRPLWRVEKKQP